MNESLFFFVCLGYLKNIQNHIVDFYKKKKNQQDKTENLKALLSLKT